MFGKIYSRFFLNQYFGISDENEAIKVIKKIISN